MDLSGMIFVLLAVAWAVYLIPKALRRSDEAARTRSIDRFSPATRVLARREPVSRRDARLVVTPPRPGRARSGAAAWTATASHAGAVAAEVVEPGPERTPAPAAAPTRPSSSRAAARRTAARVAARRRRRMLALLLLCVVGTAAAAYTGRGPWWWVAVPAALTLAFVVLCRVLVRRDAARPRTRPVPPPSAKDGKQVDLGLEAPGGVPAPADERRGDHAAVTEVAATAVDADRVADFDDTEDTVGLSAAELREAAGSAAPASGSLWDPLPMTLPTYVSKPKARRTVRTIDLGEPGTWTSGRTPEAADLAAASDQADATTTPATPATESEQRAVGS